MSISVFFFRNYWDRLFIPWIFFFSEKLMKSFVYSMNSYFLISFLRSYWNSFLIQWIFPVFGISWIQRSFPFFEKLLRSFSHSMSMYFSKAIDIIFSFNESRILRNFRDRIPVQWWIISSFFEKLLRSLSHSMKIDLSWEISEDTFSFHEYFFSWENDEVIFLFNEHFLSLINFWGRAILTQWILLSLINYWGGLFLQWIFPLLETLLRSFSHSMNISFFRSCGVRFHIQWIFFFRRSYWDSFLIQWIFPFF